jgi:hypothetical protein
MFGREHVRNPRRVKPEDRHAKHPTSRRWDTYSESTRLSREMARGF